jgi:hypothetical protein
MRTCALAILLLLAGGPAARAADAEDNYVVWGPGRMSCNSYLKDRESGAGESRYRDFLMGYLSAHNALSAETFSVSGDMPLGAILHRVDEYCEAHRIEGLERAIRRVLADLHPSRWRSAPRPGGGWTR